jgi:hypothetical protein
MNNFFNFDIPEFQKKYGQDWDAFKTIMGSEFDILFQKTWELYDLNNISKMDARIVQFWLDLYKIPYGESDTVQTKKLRLRFFIEKQKNKAMEAIFLDLGEQITGIRGALYCGSDIGVWRWGFSRWAANRPIKLMRWNTTPDRWTTWRWSGMRTGRLATFLRWSQALPQFIIYFDVKTTDPTMLDQIQSLLQDKNVKPAFYKIYLCDSLFNILRTV